MVNVVGGTCAFIRKRDVFVDVMLPMVPIEVSDSFELERDKRVLRDNGDNETFAKGTKIP